MKSIQSVLDIPMLDTVIVEYKGERYTAIETDIRFIQLQVAKGVINIKDIKVFDIDTVGEEYEMIFREDGKFTNNFTCNIFRLGSECVLNLLGIDRKKRKQAFGAKN